jgi:hypothetical protein
VHVERAGIVSVRQCCGQPPLVVVAGLLATQPEKTTTTTQPRGVREPSSIRLLVIQCRIAAQISCCTIPAVRSRRWPLPSSAIAPQRRRHCREVRRCPQSEASSPSSLQPRPRTRARCSTRPRARPPCPSANRTAPRSRSLVCQPHRSTPTLARSRPARQARHCDRRQQRPGRRDRARAGRRWRGRRALLTQRAGRPGGR